MTEETENEETNEDTNKESNEQEWEPSTDTEKAAAKLGYHPDKGEKSADQFLMYHEARQDLRSENKSAKKLAADNKNLQAQIDKLSQNQSTQIGENIAFYESRISVLENNLTGAKENGHTEMAVEIMEQLAKEKTQLTKLKGTVSTAPATNLNTAVLDEWSEENDWVNDGSEKAQFAKDLFIELQDEVMAKLPANSNQSAYDARWRRILRKVERDTAEEFDEEPPVKGARKKAPKTVKGKKTTERVSNVRNIKSLQADERAIYRAQVKSDKNPRGIWTEKQFWEQYDKVKGAQV